ncbi:MAG: hypothetical protein IIA92_13680 [Chloroflexi bacterium]|nr:hypothetical protein [Chloroflexota bacterium]
MPYHSNNIGRVQLDDFVEAIPRLYARLDQHRTISDSWLHANHHAASIGEEVRKEKPGEMLLQEIADFAMWLFTVLGKLRGDIGEPNMDTEKPEETLYRIRHNFSDLLWNKYPGMCPVCYWRRTEGDRDREKESSFDAACDCLLHDVESRDQSQKQKHVIAIRGFANDIRDRKPTSVDNWQEMFGRIFRSNLRHIDLPKIAFHLLEEMGEVSDAMARTYTYGANVALGEPSWKQVWLEEELADVASWLFALVEKLDIIRQTADSYDRWRYRETVAQRGPILLSGIIWRRYGSDDLQDFYCPHCKSLTACTCAVNLVPSTIGIDMIKANVTESLQL